MKVSVVVDGVPPPPPPPPPPMSSIPPPPPPPPPVDSVQSSKQNQLSPVKTVKKRKLHWKPLGIDYAKDSFWKLSVSRLVDQKLNDESTEQEDIERLFEIFDNPSLPKNKMERKILGK